MRRLFGTDGIRGVANVEPMTVETALKLGRAAAHVFKTGAGRHQIVIGKDTRLSCYMIENALAAGICSMGVDILLVGPLPTPGIAFITSSMRADAGVVISASHNPFQDNGIKFFSRDGYKLPDEIEEKMEDLIYSGTLDSIRPTAKEVGKAYRLDDAKGRYIVYLKHSFPDDLTLEGLKIVVDCANGAAYKVAPAVFAELGAEVVALNDRPNGENINRNCGSTYPDLVCRVTRESGSNIGIALDGDGDRVIFSDEKGNMLDGDVAMAVCASRMIRGGSLKKKTLVATVMSNMGLEEVVQAAGGRLVRTPVGDRYVAEEMVRGGYNLGGEQSGHVIFRDHTTTGDGVITALQVIAIMIREGKPLSELGQILTLYPQVLVNVPLSRREELNNFPSVRRAIEEAEQQIQGRGRVLVRLSGTEPIARIFVEGKDEKEINGVARALEEAIRQALG